MGRVMICGKKATKNRESAKAAINGIIGFINLSIGMPVIDIVTNRLLAMGGVQ